MITIIGTPVFSQRYVTGDSNTFYGVKFQKIKAVIQVMFRNRVSVASMSFSGNTMLAPTNNPDAFNNVKVGDTINISGTSSNNGDRVITAILSGREALVSGSAFSTETSNCVIDVQTNMDSVSIRYSVTPQEAPTLNSIIDTTVQELFVEGYSSASTSFVDLNFRNTSKNTLKGVSRVKRLTTGVDYDNQKYEINIEFFIDPVTLPNQYLDTLSEIPPDYFSSFRQLNFSFEVDMYNSANPITARTSQRVTTYANSNTGWLNEIGNGLATPYELSAPTVSNPDLTTDEIPIELTLTNTGASGFDFSDNNTPIQLCFGYCPEASVEYIGKSELKEGFFFDVTGLRKPSQSAINGDNFGTDYQVLKDYEVDYVSATEVTIKFTLALSQFIVDYLKTRPRKAFIIGVTVSPHNTYAPSSLAYLDTFFFDNSDTGVIKSAKEVLITPAHLGKNNSLSSDPIVWGQWGEELPCIVRSGDICAFHGLYYWDLVGRDASKISLTGGKFNISAVNSITGDRFTLMEETFNTPLYPTIEGVPFLDMTAGQLTTNFSLPTLMRNAFFKSKTGAFNDINNKYFEFYVPFVVRCDEFFSVLGASDDFYNPNTPPLYDLTDEWYRYSQHPNWDVVMTISFDTIYEDFPTTISFTHVLNVEHFLENPEWGSETITTKTPQNVVLSNGDPLILLSDQDTTVEITYNYIGGGTPPEVSEISFVGYITSYGNRWTGYKWISSDRWDFNRPNPVNIFLQGIDNPYAATITRSGTTYKVVFKTINERIENAGYQISGRIYNKEKFAVQDSSEEMFIMSDGRILYFS
jgi:hypothetical protein